MGEPQCSLLLTVVASSYRGTVSLEYVDGQDELTAVTEPNSRFTMSVCASRLGETVQLMKRNESGANLDC